MNPKNIRLQFEWDSEKICKTSKSKVLRFVLRNRRMRMIGAGYWRKERKIYEERNR